MRILVVSDTHGNTDSLRKAIERQPDAKLIIHLGDGLREFDDIVKELDSGVQFRAVQGNSDWPSDFEAQISGFDIIRGIKIFYTHGHRYNVKFDYDKVIYAAKEREADILLFGHTHQPLKTYDNGLHILNPGSLGYGQGSYGTVDITDRGIVTNIIKL